MCTPAGGPGGSAPPGPPSRDPRPFPVRVLRTAPTGAGPRAGRPAPPTGAHPDGGAGGSVGSPGGSGCGAQGRYIRFAERSVRWKSAGSSSSRPPAFRPAFGAVVVIPRPSLRDQTPEGFKGLPSPEARDGLRTGPATTSTRVPAAWRACTTSSTCSLPRVSMCITISTSPMEMSAKAR